MLVSPRSFSSMDAILRSTRRMIFPDRVLGRPAHAQGGTCKGLGFTRVARGLAKGQHAKNPLGVLTVSQHDLVMRKAERAWVTDSQRFIGVSGADLTGQPVQPQLMCQH